MVPGTVSSIVRSALRTQLALTAAESLVLGASAALVTLAAAVAGGTAVGERQAAAAAAVTALLTACSWAIERRPRADSVARRMDGQFRLSGGVLTALETEANPSSSALAVALSARIAPSLSRAAFARHAARSSAMLLVAPFVALTFWNLATDAQESARVDGRGAPAAPGGTVRSDDAADLASEATRLAVTPGLPAELVDRLRALAARADELRAPSAQSAEERGARELDLASQLEELRRAAAGAAVTPGASDGTMAGPGARTVRDPDAAMPPVNPSRHPAAPGNDAASEGERGVVGSRWWPQRYDAVVERWIEARRNAGDGRNR
ncbi:MAG TPA: hypothetical protein VGR31_11695 [Planctomycetota bacterium]|jgi:hypothetical protein|nr:hypothetical protein [Planctomycetota bacterium]